MTECERCGRSIELRTLIDMHGQKHDRWMPEPGWALECPKRPYRYCKPT